MSELHAAASNLLRSKYNVLLEIDCRDFDLTPENLIDHLDRIKKDNFDVNDRIVIVHMDTDYYDELLPYGLLIINLVRIFQSKELPFFTLLFITNHFGIKKEFDSLLINHDVDDRPTIIETLLSRMLLTNNINTDNNTDFDKIEKPGICMMGAKRLHRILLANYLNKNNLLDKVALKTNFK